MENPSLESLIQERVKQYVSRISLYDTPGLRERELQKIFDEIDLLIKDLPLSTRDSLRNIFYSELKIALLELGYSFVTLGLETHGGLEWLTKSNTVGNEEALELMRMVAKGPEK